MLSIKHLTKKFDDLIAIEDVSKLGRNPQGNTMVPEMGANKGILRVLRKGVGNGWLQRGQRG